MFFECVFLVYVTLRAFCFLAIGIDVGIEPTFVSLFGFAVILIECAN